MADYSAYMAPKHRRAVRADAASQADCICRTGPHSICPRHDADVYAEVMARHCIDSIGPLR